MNSVKKDWMGRPIKGGVGDLTDDGRVATAIEHVSDLVCKKRNQCTGQCLHTLNIRNILSKLSFRK